MSGIYHAMKKKDYKTPKRALSATDVISLSMSHEDRMVKLGRVGESPEVLEVTDKEAVRLPGVKERVTWKSRKFRGDSAYYEWGK